MKITLKFTPQENYFFGSENKKADGTDNYFLKSSALPQPTTILGAIRYWMLLNADDTIFNNNKINDKNKAAVLIGDRSFSIGTTDFKFGKLLSVSNLFLLNGENKKHLIAPYWKDKKDQELVWNKELNAAILPSYNAKKYYTKSFISAEEKELQQDDIFKEIIDSHNRKNNREVGDKNAYFKTQFYALKNKFSFGVQIEVDNEFKFKDALFMKMGGENKLFKVEALKDNELPSNEVILEKYKHPSLYKLVLTSDTYMDAPDFSSCLFKYITTKPFRSLYTKVDETENYSALSKDNNKVVKSSQNLLQLIETGSIFYFNNKNNAECFTKQIKNDYLNKSGFNHFILLNPLNQ